MKKILLLIVVALLAGGAYLYLDKPDEPPFEPEEGYQALYDGESLDGWHVVGGGSTFTAKGEDIVGRNGPGDNTFLRTDKTYGDFSLKLQMRWDEPGNSGVMFRAGQRNGDGRVYGYQYELDDSDRSWSGGIYDEARRGWLASLEDNVAAREAIRLDDWNDIEIEARGTHLKTWINGVPAADIVDGLDARGYIALQVHKGDSGLIRWRHIQLKELPASVSEGESLLKPAEWRTENLETLTFEEGTLAANLPDGEFWMTPRRQFSEAMVSMKVPACEAPTIVRMNYLADENGNGESFAEVKIFADRAESRVVTPAGEQVMEPVKLRSKDIHRFVGVTQGASTVLTVGETDVLRVKDVGLPERGQLRIQAARCGDAFAITNFKWFSLKSGGSEMLFYQTLGDEPAPVLSASEALQAFKIAPGFEIELVAAEPLVEDPVAISWDEYGRLYVVEMRGYMRDAYGTDSEKPVGQVVRLTDTDGDGQMDSSEIFLGNLINPRAVAVVNEGVLIGEPPNLWLCELPTPDAMCSNKRRIGGYATDVNAANVEHMENGLRQGLDNWLYNSKSSRSLRIEDGELVEREGLFRGQWGITKDDYGRLLYNHNSTWIQADFYAAEDMVQPGETVSPPGLGVNLTSPAKVFSVRVNPGVNRAYLPKTLREDGRLNDATGASGLVAYRGDQFPEQYRGDVFVPEAAGNVVAQFAMSENGMALQAEQRLYEDERWGQRDFLGSTDERFRPVDAMNGPDGALYIIDMYRGIVQDDHFLTDELRAQIFQRELETPLGMGRIWRVRHTEGKSTRELPQLATATSAELVAALVSANGWERDTAQRLLLHREGDLTAALSAVARGDNTVPALHAIWVLEGRDELSRELVLELALSGDVQRQVQVLRAGADTLQEADLLALHEAYAEAPPAVALQLALTMGAYAGNSEIRIALSDILSNNLANPFVRQAVIRAAAGHELAFLQEYLSADRQYAASKDEQGLMLVMTYQAYLTLRGDLASAEPANVALLDLLTLLESRRDENAWQQIAGLQGLALAAASKAFTPALLAAAPPIFSDGTIGEEDPLWNARLAGRAAFTWPGDELALGITPLSPEQLQVMAKGEEFYPQCGACHGAQGAGISGLAPPLAAASWVTGPPEWLARIILQGLNGPIEVAGETFDGVMPPHGHLPELDDETLAGLMTYLRRSWGNKADPVTAETVAAIRAASADRSQPWTAQELQAVRYDRGYARFEGEYSVSFVTFTVTEKADGLHLSVPMYGAGLMTPLSATRFGAAAGGEDVELEFVVQENGEVNRMILHRKGEAIPVKRKK